MATWIDWLTGTKNNSADEAKERLKLVLIHDRTDLTPDALEKLKDEIVSVISKYIEIDQKAVNISVTHDGREQRLMADIPLKAARSRRRAG
jgi:cell division topological specificity factor